MPAPRPPTPQSGVFGWGAPGGPRGAASPPPRGGGGCAPFPAPPLLGPSPSWITRVFISAPVVRVTTPPSRAVVPWGKGENWRFPGSVFLPIASGTQEQQNREHAARLAARRREAELPEDARHVLLHRTQADHQRVGDPLVGAAGGHQLEHLALARSQGRERVVAPPAREQGRDDDRVD